MKQFGFFSFFTGAGFLDLGFERVGFVPLFGNEIVHDFCEAYRHSRKKLSVQMPKYGLHETSIDVFLDGGKEHQFLHQKVKEAKRELDFVGFIGGPPCPDFSIAGKNKGATGTHGRLSQSYMDLICSEKPDFFVFENVKGLWRTAVHRAFFESLVTQAHKAGYSTATRLINALEYGAPQDRERIILIGVKRQRLNGMFSEEFNLDVFPWLEHIEHSLDTIKQANWPETDDFKENGRMIQPKGIVEELTVEHWFKQNRVDKHPNSNNFFIPRAGLVKMQTYKEGDDSKKCYKRLHRWRYSPTAAYGNNEVHLHPYKARRLSVAEALAIQSLPAEYELPQSMTLSAMFKTVGNGVPFVAAKGIAETLKDFLETNTRG